MLYAMQNMHVYMYKYKNILYIYIYMFCVSVYDDKDTFRAKQDNDGKVSSISYSNDISVFVNNGFLYNGQVSS